MKAKILALLGLTIAAVGIALVFNVAPAHAQGEKYEWINATTIRASGGLYSDVSAAKNGVINFPKVGSSYQITSKGSCDITMTITASIDNKNGHLETQGCVEPAKGFDRDFTIAHPEKGPPLDGSEVNYATVNCSQYYSGGDNVTRCEAVKKCVVEAQKPTDQCLAAWATCIVNHSKNGPISATDKQACVTAVAGGDLTAATAAPAATSTTDDKKTSCAIDGIGWIVCPIVNFLAKVVDAAYGIVSSLLTVQPLLVTGQTKSIYDAWSIMRNFANVAFVIAFLIIIFSQLTSVGITNYGIKKMLPRLIIAAVLVNISYWVCAIAVDVSNILGTSLKGLFDGIGGALALPADKLSPSQTGSGWEGYAGAILAGAGIGVAFLYIGLSALIPILIVVLLAIITVFIVLALRQALIILLIVVAPLAFVAYLLPNTESLFKKWRDLLQTLLLMYPIIALIFGASALASKIVIATASGSEGQKIAIQIMGAGIAVIPLAITPIVMKTAGGLLNRFGGVINNPNKGPFDRMRKGAEGYRTNRQEYRKLKALNGYRTLPGRGVTTRQGAIREAVLNNRKTELNRANASYVAGLAEQNDSFRGKLAQGGGEGADTRALAGAINIQAELQAKEVKAASAVIEHMNLSSDQINDIAKGSVVTKDGRTLSGADDATRKAAITEAVSKGTIGDVESVIKSAGTMTSSQHKVLSDAVASNSVAGKATHLAGQTIDDISQGKVTSEEDLDRVMARAIERGKYSAEKIAENDKDSLKRLAGVMGQGRTDISAGKLDNLKEQAEKAATDSRISGRITDAQRAYIDQIR